LNPKAELWEEDEVGDWIPYKPQLTATQAYLWQCLEEDLATVESIARGAPIWIVHAGDLCHGDKYPEQLVSTRKADQVVIATANVKRVLELPNIQALRLIEGTGAHTFAEGSATILVANQLRAEHRDLDIECRAHSLLNIWGVEMDCAHHGPSPGIRNWTAGRQLRYYVQSVMLDCLADGQNPPGALIRAHNHTGRHETVRIHTRRGTFTTEAILLPAYCGLSGYARQVTRSKYRIDIGLILLEIIKGKIIECHMIWRTLDLRSRETW
jgi:hypothetical protein